MKIISQVIFYALFFSGIAYLTAEPQLRLLPEDQAIISISFSHSGKRVGECKRLTTEELLSLAPNMRQPDECPRERHHLQIELAVDRVLLYATLAQPSGLWSDGKSTIYQRLMVPSGMHELSVRMGDSGASDVFDFSYDTKIELSAGQNLVVRFDSSSQQFIIN